MDTQELEQILFEELGFAGKPNLQFGTNNIEWPNGRAIPNVNAALSLQNSPVVYFSRFSKLDLTEIQRLHKNVWSQSKAPLLFVILPHEIRIYNGYEPTPIEPNEEFDTPNRLLRHLTELTDYLTAQREIKEKLVDTNHYERVYLETGAFWDTTDGRKIKHQTRADQLLVEGMGQMRKLLNEAGISNHLAYTLLGRSIFIRYLEDRGVLTPDWVYQMTDGMARYYREALPDRQATYLLFEKLSERFNGDLFPVEEAETDITNEHLEVLLSFLNRTNLKTGQLSLWPFNFEFIPIELISNIYDTFSDNQRTSGAYYTPLLLADFILEESMDDDVIQTDMTVLDPACGSGIFLVGAYRRLIQAWRRVNGKLTFQDLSRILQNNVFGVDKNREATRIAAFSLYLEILNHLSNEEIQNASFQFPPLQQKNIVDCDFFDDKIDQHFINHKFDRVVGNMPWGKGTLSKKAEAWLLKKGQTIGGKQAAPAFMLRVPEFCKQDGEIALLVPTKSTILVTSESHQEFRDRFFEKFEVRAVVNFSALRHELFSGAVSPSAAIFCTPNQPSPDNKLVYGVPKPSSLSQHLKAIILDTTEIKFLNREELLIRPELWKVALWGMPRDAVLIERLKAVPTLKTQLEQLGWQEPREGFQIGESKNEKRDKLRKPIPDFLKKLPFLPTDSFQPFYINPTPFTPVDVDRVYRTGDKERFQSPMVLIHKSKCQAVFVDKDISFLDSISGVNGKLGQERLLKWLVCLINSPLTRYYQFLTSTRWAVERANPLHKEYLEMPFLIPDREDSKFQQLLYHFDQIIDLLSRDRAEEIFFDPKREEPLQKHQTAINDLIFDLYKLHPVERQLVDDMLEYGLEFFNWSRRKNRKPRGVKPVQRPDVPMLKRYAGIFIHTTTSLLKIKNQTLNATIYKNGTPLTVVSFDLVDLADQQPISIVSKSEEMRIKLRELDELLLERNAPSMYTRQHVRVYDGKQVSLVRPSEQRFWTQSQSRTDADAFLAELSL